MNTRTMTVKMQVVFNFGSVVYVSVRLIEGLTLAECIKRRSADIIGYIDPKGYHEI